MAAFLVLNDGTEIAVADGLILGRVKGCDVIVKDSKASRRHARLVSMGGVVEIEDLESSNGTKLNGKLIKRRMLRDGDEILIGTSKITFREGAAGGSVAAAFEGGEDLFAAESPAVVEPHPAESHPAEPHPAEPHPAESQPAESRPAESTPAEPVAFEPEIEVRSPAALSSPEPVDEVLEFADDEVVMVKRSLPQPAAPKVPKATGGRDGGVLQFHKVEDRGVAGQDLRQMSGPQRLALFVFALAVAAGLFYLTMTIVSS